MRDWVTIVFFLLSGMIAVRKKSLVTVYLVKLVLIVPGILLLLVRSEVELVPGLGEDLPPGHHVDVVGPRHVTITLTSAPWQVPAPTEL